MLDAINFEKQGIPAVALITEPFVLTAEAVATSNWTHPYTREQAAFPLPFVKADKFWPPVGRIDNAHGDRNLICTCPDVAEYVNT